MTDIEKPKDKAAVDWQKLSDEWQQSGLSQPEFCKRNDINYSQFVVLRSKFLRAAGLSRHPFKPVKIKPASLSLTQPVQIHLPNGVRVQVASDTNPVTLSMVLRSLGYSAC